MWRTDDGGTVFVHPTHDETITRLSVGASPYAALSQAGGRTPLAFGTALGRVFVAHVLFPSSLSRKRAASGDDGGDQQNGDVRRPSLTYEHTQKLLGGQSSKA